MADQSDAADQPAPEGPAEGTPPADTGAPTAPLTTADAGASADATQPLEATAPVPSVDATAVEPSPVDASAVAPAPVDATAVDGPAAGDEPKLPSWSARAAVRPGVRPLPQSLPWSDEEIVADPYDGRSWFTPIIIGTVTLILLAMLTGGLWLIYVNSRAKPVSELPPATTSVSVTPSAPASTPGATTTRSAVPPTTSSAPSTGSTSSSAPAPSNSPSLSKAPAPSPPTAVG